MDKKFYYPNTNVLVKNVPVDNNAYDFVQWLREKKVYKEFLKFCDLTELMEEKNPYQFFVCLDWDSLAKFDRENEFEFLIDHWFDFLEDKNLEKISSGIKISKKLKEEKYFKNFLLKMEAFDLNSISFEQAKQISRILF